LTTENEKFPATMFETVEHDDINTPQCVSCSTL
jgi:hypothetical protein